MDTIDDARKVSDGRGNAVDGARYAMDFTINAMDNTNN